MHGNKTWIIVAIVAGVVVLAIIAYFIARFLRGTIKLTLVRTAFNPGDTITGSFDLHAKKAIEGNKLVVRLIGTQITETSREEKTGTDTDSKEIYRDEVVVEGARAYPAGHMATHQFEIATPQTQTPEFLNSTTGQILSSALRFATNNSTRIKWQIEVRLDAKGIDLATSKPVTINIKSLI